MSFHLIFNVHGINCNDVQYPDWRLLFKNFRTAIFWILLTRYGKFFKRGMMYNFDDDHSWVWWLLSNYTSRKNCLFCNSWMRYFYNFSLSCYFKQFAHIQSWRIKKFLTSNSITMKRQITVKRSPVDYKSLQVCTHEELLHLQW